MTSSTPGSSAPGHIGSRPERAALRFLTHWLWILLVLVTVGGCSNTSEVLSLEVRQRTIEPVFGLGFDGRVFVRVGDIQTSDLINRRVQVEEVEVFDGGGTLGWYDAMAYGDRMFFRYRGEGFWLSIEEFTTSIVLDDWVTFTIYSAEE